MDVLFDAEHFFDGYKRNPEFALRVLEAAATKRRVARLVLCDTNGGALPHEVERIVGEVVAYFGGDVGVAVHLHDDARHRRRQRARRRARRRDAGAGHDQRLRRAHRQLQPHDDHPEPHAEDGHRDDPGRPARPAHAGRAPRRRAREHAAQPAGARTSGTRRSRTRPGCTRARSRSGPTRTSTSSPDVVGNGTRFVVSELAGKSTLVLKAKELGLELDGPQLAEVVEHAQAARARGLPLRGRRRFARAADAAGDRLGARLVRGRVVPRHHRRPPRRRHAHRRDAARR